MQSVFSSSEFEFPYHYKFPGQATDERILFITRENPIMLWIRRGAVLGVAAVLLITGIGMASFVTTFFGLKLPTLFTIITVMVAAAVAGIGWWWVTTLWQKSLGIITTKRLTKFIYTTPFNRHSLSLPLEMIVDTGSYSKGFLQALFKLETFTARSSASSSGAATDDGDRINKKYFYLENIAIAEDLQHYLNKLLNAFRQYHEHLGTFRPFIPKLKGDQRKQFMERFPEYWS